MPPPTTATRSGRRGARPALGPPVGTRRSPSRASRPRLTRGASRRLLRGAHVAREAHLRDRDPRARAARAAEASGHLAERRAAGPGDEPRLGPGGHHGAAGEDVAALGLHALADRRVDEAGAAHGQRRAPWQGGQAEIAGGVVARGLREEPGDGPLHRLAGRRREGRAERGPELAEAAAAEDVVGHVEPAELPVLVDVAADVGELHRHAQVGGVLQRRLVRDPEDVAHHQADGAGDAEAVREQVVERRVAMPVGIHPHAGEELGG